MVPQLDSEAFHLVVYPSLAGTTPSLDCLLDTNVIWKKETKIEHLVSGIPLVTVLEKKN